ncbi:MAG: hypothetical protein AAGB26_10660 [Planctomycetota bacterium]
MSISPLRLFVLALVGVLLLGSQAYAQQADIEIVIQRENLGLGGIVQRGVWTPVRMDLTNTGAEDVQVHCRWLLTDEDGDQLIAERSNVTLQPVRPLNVWLYATPPMSTRPDQTWTFQAVDVQSGELLKQVQVQLSTSAVAEPSVNLVGVCGDQIQGLGLLPWLRWSTHHEELRLVSNLSLTTLPDRWYGLDSLSSLVWIPADKDNEPTDDRMSDSTKRALREWVYRGGHLVIVMPFAGQQWTGTDSGLADLLDPIGREDIKQTRATVPISVFGVLRNTEPVAMNWFDLSDAPGYTSLAEVEILKPLSPEEQARIDLSRVLPNEPKPLIVGKRFGFGQVTLVGIDLSNADVLKKIDSFRLHRVWTRIFSWRASMTGELLPDSEFDGQQTRSQYWEAKDAQQVELGNWMASRVAREGETGPAIGLAFVLFVLYAIFAALTFPNLLKAKGLQRHSWMLFVCIVAIFSIAAWGGAWFMRPAATSSAHFTVLDIDGNTNRVRAQSWQSLLIPNFATADVEVASKADGLALMDVINLMASPGNDLMPDSPGYPDQRVYTYDVTQPSALGIPMRSTTKSLKVDFLGQITGQQDGLQRPWKMPQATLSIGNNGLPAGTITHEFPDALTDVRIIFCPGGAQQPARPGSTTIAPGRPLVYQFKNAEGQSVWTPGTPLVLPASAARYSPLWTRPSLTLQARNWRAEGYLGHAVADRAFASGSASNSNVVEDIPLLSFYGALPPPIYKVQSGGGFGNQYNVYSRSLVRDLDLTHLITGRRIILIGHLRDSPSPVPLTVDGDTIPSQGWTVVRWVYDL